MFYSTSFDDGTSSQRLYPAKLHRKLSRDKSVGLQIHITYITWFKLRGGLLHRDVISDIWMLSICFIPRRSIMVLPAKDHIPLSYGTSFREINRLAFRYAAPTRVVQTLCVTNLVHHRHQSQQRFGWQVGAPPTFSLPWCPCGTYIQLLGSGSFKLSCSRWLLSATVSGGSRVHRWRTLHSILLHL